MVKKVDPIWYLTKDGDRDCLAMYEKHYSAYKYQDGRIRSQFVGPGETIVLRTLDATAFFVWRKFIDDSGQIGVNCAAFRNESEHKSKELIRQACRIADLCWPGERHYTYVDAKKIRSTNPGFCFLLAGWRRLKRKTISGKRILERSARPTGERRLKLRDRHKRPIEPDITGGVETAGNGTAKPLTQSNGKNAAF